MQHFENKENIGLSFVRQLSDAKPYTNILVSQYPIEKRTNYSFQGAAYLAPLYLYGEHLGEISRTPNFSKAFYSNYLRNISWKPSAEDVLSYMYAVLHSPVYRRKYNDFLRTDFPAIPMSKSKVTFNKYSKLGNVLINLHLLKNIPDDKTISVNFDGVKGIFIFENVLLANNSLNITVSSVGNNSKGGLIVFKGVSSDFYDFEIGALKPIDLWIKNRIKDKVQITINDLQHIKNMIIAIKETIKAMNNIEELGEEYLNDI